MAVTVGSIKLNRTQPLLGGDFSQEIPGLISFCFLFLFWSFKFQFKCQLL